MANNEMLDNAFLAIVNKNASISYFF